VTYFKKSNIFLSNYFLFTQWLLNITGSSCHWNCKTLVWKKWELRHKCQ
jgi:hypothetical protein